MYGGKIWEKRADVCDQGQFREKGECRGRTGKKRGGGGVTRRVMVGKLKE